MKEYDIHVPLFYNDKTPIEPRKFQDLQKYLLRHFDGLTVFPQPNQGYWKLGDVTYHDEIVIYRVIATDSSRTKRILRRLKKQLKESLDQEEILILYRRVGTL